MNSKPSLALTTTTHANACQFDDASVLTKGCFAGSETSEICLSENDYIFSERLGAGEYGEVYKAQLRNNQLRQYAIKKVALTSSLAKRYSENELVILQSLRKLQHPNVIDFHGWFDRSGYRFLIFQLGDVSFDIFIDRNLGKFNYKHINEILYQLIGMIEALVSLELQADDFNKKNMVYCTSDKRIKLIDFEKYLTPNQTGYISPLVPLPLVGLEVSHIQIEMGNPPVDQLRKAKTNFSRAARLALRALYSNREKSLNSQQLLTDTDNWNGNLPDTSRRLVAGLFDSGVDFKTRILPLRESLLERTQLS